MNPSKPSPNALGNHPVRAGRRHSLVAIAFVTALIGSGGCDPLPPEDVESGHGPEDRPLVPDLGLPSAPIGEIGTVSEEHESDGAALTAGEENPGLIAQVGEVVKKGSELASWVGKAKAAYNLGNTWLHLFDYVGDEPSMPEQMAAIQKSINELADLTVDQYRQGIHGDIEFSFRQALRHSRHALLNGTTVSEDFGTEKAMFWASSDAAFERIHRLPPRPRWFHRELIKPEDTANNGKIWDWRLGLPFLMLHSNLRTVVMAAQDRNYHRNPVMMSELDDMREDVYTALLKMVNGIRCGQMYVETRNFVDPIYLYKPLAPGAEWRMYVACLDIHTGVYYEEKVRAFHPDSIPSAKKLQSDALLQVHGQLRDKIMAGMPIQAAVSLIVHLNSLKIAP